MDEPEKKKIFVQILELVEAKFLKWGKSWNQRRVNIFLESWTKVEREREEGRDFFFGISNGEKWKEKEDSFGKKNKSGIVMEDKS